MMPRHVLLLVLVAIAGAARAEEGVVAPAPAVDFEGQIRPIFQQRCAECHTDKLKGGLRLDLRAQALEGGDSGRVILPGKSAASPLMERVTSTDKDLRMPPEGERLSAEQIALLRRWIDEGAAWPAEREPQPTHWSLRTLTRVEIPKAVDAQAAARNPIDLFVQAKLTARGVAPSPEADRRTWARRVYYDLTGLPPTPEQLAAFLADSGPLAYERLVDALLASPRYGEHWARHWLDVAHYADTHGNDHDYARPNAWPYRDYVIAAFNGDKPYARFVEEQVAGDALFPDDPKATVALGFLAAGPWDHTLMSTIREDTVDHRLAQYLDRDNMVSTVMSTFQSLTVHCARCHNHKFDPISQREYYGLQAVFAGVDRADRAVDADARTFARRRDLLARQKAIAARDPVVLAALDAPEMQQRVAAALVRPAAAWQPLEVINVTSVAAPDGTLFARKADGSWLVSGTKPDRDTFVITARTSLAGVRAVRLEVLPDESLPEKGPGRYPNGNFHLSEVHISAQPATGETSGAKKLEIARAISDHSEPQTSGPATIDGKEATFWSVHPKYGEPHELVLELKAPISFEGGTILTVRLDFHGKPGHQIGRFRLFVGNEALSADQWLLNSAEVAAFSRLPPDKQTDARRDIFLRLLAADVERELAALTPPRMVFAATRDFAPEGSFKPSREPRPVHMLARGDINRPGEVIGPAALGCVPELPRELTIDPAGGESQRRAALAHWLTDPGNALTWRSIVNRVWHYHFGRGICDTPNDFGKMGGVPSHPELLDWLALWFRDDARGSLKALHRLIVTSAAYRQSSVQRAEAAALDADNRLLWRMNGPRLTAEQIRDSVLQFTGRIDLTMGGPSVVQFGDKGAATFKPPGGEPPAVDYENFDPDSPRHARRAVYRFLFRTVPDPLMDALDCPDGGQMTPVRGESTTALQAFAMLNNVFLIRQCEHIAARLGSNSEKTEKQVEAAFELILLRPPRPAERDAFVVYVNRHGLANACQLLINSNEFLYVD